MNQSGVKAMRGSKRVRPSFAILCCALGLTCGCQIVGAVAGKALGPTKVKPEYAFPQEPMLVLAEAYGRANELQPAADELANELADELRQHKVAPLVPGDRLLALRSERPDEFNQMKIPDVGRALGAAQVLYVDLKQCEVDGVPGADVIYGRIEAKVRIVDVATGQTKWPNTGDGHVLRSDTEYVRKEAHQTPLAVRNQMLQDLAAAIARLFYEYQPDYDTGRGLQPE
jgi:hypothetical protein